MAKNLRSTSVTLDDESMKNLVKQISTSVSNIITADIQNKFDTVNETMLRLGDLTRTHSERLLVVDHKIDRLEQYTRRNNLRLFGVEESRGENTDVIVLSILKSTLGVDISINDLERTHRIGNRSDTGKGRAIIIKFCSYRKRCQVYEVKKKLKGSKLALTEDLTKHRYRAYQAVAKKYSLKNTWTRDGTIYYVCDGKITKVSEEEIDIFANLT